MLKYTIYIFSIAFLMACSHSGSKIQQQEKTESTAVLMKDEVLDTTAFWKIMDNAFNRAKFDNERRQNAILDQLIKLTPEQIQQFEIVFQEMNQKSSTWKLMAAHTVIEGGSSDDTFFYFRCWLISLGKNNFEESLRNPDYLASLDFPINKDYGYGEVLFEELISISDQAYSTVTGKTEEDETFPRAYCDARGLFYDSGTSMKGKNWTDTELPLIVPKLYQRFNRN